VSPAVTIAEDATRRNGTGAAMPIKTAVVAFDEVGYPGWHATLRTNPRASVYDDFLSQDQERFCPALGQIVREWNLADEDGNPLPLPAHGLDPKELPYDVINHLVRGYIDAFNAAAAVPKGSSDSSGGTSSTSGGAPRSE
jgi:hypothetical protein